MGLSWFPKRKGENVSSSPSDRVTGTPNRPSSGGGSISGAGSPSLSEVSGFGAAPSPTIAPTVDYAALIQQVLASDSAAITKASHTTSGIVRIATAPEVTFGNDTTIAVSPGDLAASDYGERIIGVLVESGENSLGVGDAKNGNYFRIPSSFNGWNIIDVAAQVLVVGSTGTTDIQLRNITDGTDVLSTKLTIDSGEKDSATAATPATIGTDVDDVATGDQFAWDVDAVHSITAPKGLYCEVILRKPQ